MKTGKTVTVIEYMGKDMSHSKGFESVVDELEKSRDTGKIHILADESEGRETHPHLGSYKNAHWVNQRNNFYQQLLTENSVDTVFRYVPKAYDIGHRTFENMLQFFSKEDAGYVYGDGDDLALNGMTLELIAKDLLREILEDHDPFLPDGSLNAWKNGTCAPYLFSLDDQAYYYQGKYKDYYRYPRNLNLELSRVCNLSCDMCMYYSKRYPRFFSVDNTPYMSFDLYKKIIDQIAQFDRKPSVELCYRGEPLLNDHIADMVAYSRERGIMTIVITNATRLDQHLTEAFLDHDLDMIMFSIDAFSGKTYENIRHGSNFEKVIAKVDRYLDLNEKKQSGKSQTIVKLVYQKANMDEVDLFVEKWIERTDLVVIQNMIVPNDSEYEVVSTQDQIGTRFKNHQLKGRLPCRNPWLNMVVTTDGTVLYCAGDYRECHSPGSLAERDVLDLWQAEDFQEIRELQLQGRYSEIPLCSKCDGKSCSGLTLEKRLSDDLFSTYHIIHEIHRKKKDVYRV